jgi:choline dehydrogenase
VERISCDVVVLGGGTAGCVVAGRLASETDADVVVVEAGPDYGPRNSGRWPADLLDGGALVASHSWRFDTGVLHPLRAPVELPRARVIGGCSAHNGCIAAVGCVDDYDGWARIVGDARWSADALRPLFARVLERLRVRYYAEGEVGPFHRACLDAAGALGIPRVDDLADLDGGAGFGIEPVNVDGGVRVNTAFAYLDPARSRPNLRVVDHALCDRVVPSPGGIEAVVKRGRDELRVGAGVGVLSAGSYGSPAILLRSGIGEAGVLARHGIAVVHELRGVGANLHDHPLLELDFAGSDRLREELADAARERFVPEEQTLGKLRSTRASGPYDVHLIPVAAPEHSLLAGRTILAVGAMEPRSRGRLTLASADPEAAPVMDHGYLSDPHDVAVLREGIERARELAATEPLRSLVGRELVAHVDIEAAIRRTHVHYYHPVGTCALGPAADELAVCDARGRLHGLERIVVADCSLMPVVPRANTNVPAAVVGERIADELLAGL